MAQNINRPGWLNTREFFILTLADWSHVPEGVQPEKCSFPELLGDRDHTKHPGGYIEHEFYFSDKPTREDFRFVVNYLGWMHSWKERLLPLLDRNEWPLIDVGCKAASVDLKDENGRVVGRIQVYRHDMWQVKGYMAPIVGKDVITRTMRKRVPAEKLEEVVQALWVGPLKNRILEKLISQPAGYQDEDIPVAIVDVAVEAGFYKRKKEKCPA